MAAVNACGDLKQFLLGCLDLSLAVHLRVAAERVVDDLLAHVDQLAAQPGVMDRPAILARVDDADHRRQQLGEVGGPPHLIQHTVMLELGAQCDGVGKLAVVHPAVDGCEDPPMDRVGEMFGRQELRHPFEGAVVGQQSAEQRLFGLHVGRRQPL